MSTRSQDLAHDQPRPAQLELSANDLYTPCDPSVFEFASTIDLDDLTTMVGQERAVEALAFATRMESPGYNVFVLGPAGTGRHSFVRRFLSKQAAERPRAADWCYVNNFEQPRKPYALRLPGGWGRQLAHDLERLVDEACTAIPTAFEGEDYRERRQNIEDAFGKEQTARLQQIQERAREQGIAVMFSPQGLAFAPLRNGQPLSPDEIEQLPADKQESLQQLAQKIQREFQHAMQEMPQLVRKVRQQIAELDREMAMLAAGSLIDDLLEKYRDLPEVTAHLRRVQRDLIDNVQLFLRHPMPPSAKEAEAGAAPEGLVRNLGAAQPDEAPAKRRYAVNLVVDNGACEGAPLIAEDHPTYQNLIGETEYLAQMGNLVTDFSLIKGGALHRANGGYLMVDARQLLMQPFAWEGLKQVLKSKEIRIEPMGQAYSTIRTAGLEPQPIPLSAKVVLIGDRWLYYRLLELDPEFQEWFRVAADFDDRMPRDREHDLLMAQLLGTIARQEQLKPVSPDGVARLIEESSRIAAHSGRLSAQVRRTADLMREASYCAKAAGNGLIRAADVQSAIDAREHRASRLRDRMQEEVLENTLLIDTSGSQVGQVNGLSVIQLGDYAFGRATRITARVSLGAGKVVDIERETKLGGPLHSKGVLILSGFLTGRYVREQPLSLSASLVFEQSYGGVEGDSAAAGELIALLSAIADAPVEQRLAITGSVNQHGQVQAIGGANQKIEGFFELCSARGLTGDQGVLLPAANVRHLMLREEVVRAVDEGRFHIYAVRTVDEALELMTGRPAGAADERGRFPEDSVNGAVQRRLDEFADARRGYLRQGQESPSS
ncbi:MAG: Lon protease family protein [Pseudomonadales bacterium]